MSYPVLDPDGRFERLARDYHRAVARGGNRRVVKVCVSVDPADAPGDAREEAEPC